MRDLIDDAIWRALKNNNETLIPIGDYKIQVIPSDIVYDTAIVLTVKGVEKGRWTVGDYADNLADLILSGEDSIQTIIDELAKCIE